MAFHHVALNCNEPISTERFYSKYFGFRRARVIPIGDGKQIVFLKADGVYLELFQAEGAAPTPRTEKDGQTYPDVRHLAFKVENVDAKLEEMGAAADVTLGPFSFDDVIPGWRTVWVRDPDGNIVEISQGYIDEQNPPPLE
jgi:glyoxylase I family protein